MEAESPKVAAETAGQMLRNYVASFIEFPKVLVAAVNGPAVGISATFLGLFDAIFMSESATLKTPFASIAQAPEGCSSYVFPKIMGQSKANDLILFNREMTASEAKSCGFASDVFSDQEFDERVKDRLNQMSVFNGRVLENIKDSIRCHDRDLLHKVNEKECQRLVQTWQSEECAQALMEMVTKLSSK